MKLGFDVALGPAIYLNTPLSVWETGAAVVETAAETPAVTAIWIPPKPEFQQPLLFSHKPTASFPRGKRVPAPSPALEPLASIAWGEDMYSLVKNYCILVGDPEKLKEAAKLEAIFFSSDPALAEEAFHYLLNLSASGEDPIMVERYAKTMTRIFLRFSEEKQFQWLWQIRGNFRRGEVFLSVAYAFLKNLIPLKKSEPMKLELVQSLLQLGLFQIHETKTKEPFIDIPPIHDAYFLAWDTMGEVSGQIIRQFVEEADDKSFADTPFALLKAEHLADWIPEQIYVFSLLEGLKDRFYRDKMDRTRGILTPVDIDLFENLYPKEFRGITKEAIEEKLESLGYPWAIRLLVFFEHRGIPITLTQIEALLQQPNPLQYAKTKWALAKKLLGEKETAGSPSTGTEPYFFLLSLLLETTELCGKQTEHVDALKFYLEKLEEMERDRMTVLDSGPLLPTQQRVKMVKKLCEALKRWKTVSKISIWDIVTLLELGMRWISPNVQRAMAKENGATGELVRFYLSGLPLTWNYYDEWFRAENAAERERLVQSVRERKRHFLHGGDLSRDPSFDEIEMAYAAFGPSPLVTLESFAEQMRRFRKPPEIFLPESFTLEIKGDEEVQDTHHQLHKGVLEKGWKQPTPGVEAAWGLPEAQPLKDSITRYRPDISSEGLEELFFQLYLFYFQTVKQVLGESEPPLWLQRYREELKRLRLRLNPITIPPQTVHVWPWSSSMAIYGGAFRPNCIEPIDLGAELYNRRRRKKRFQVNILEADDTVLGFIYTKGALLDGARVLILGMEPRATWRFSPKKLLAAVIEKYAVIAAEAGYEKLLFCSEEDQKHRLVDITDNRDLMEAVRSAVREGQLRLWKSRQKLKGPVIDGNNFFVIWEREK